VKTKDILRYRLKQLRGNLSKSNKDISLAAINSEIIDFCQTHPANIIAGYFPTKNEINIIPSLIKLGKKIALPKITDGAMSFVEWDAQESSLENEGRFMQPASNSQVTPDIIFIPCLGYDLIGHRIGYGGGFYDKTLDKYPEAIKVVVAYSIQELLEVPKEIHDIKVDFIINENDCFSISS